MSRGHLRALMAIAEALARGQDAASVLQSVVESARELLGAESARLELLHPAGSDGPDGLRRSLVAAAGPTGLPLGTVRGHGEGTTAYVVNHGRSVLGLSFSRGLTEPPEAALTTSATHLFESGVAVPLRSRGRVLGTLSVLHSVPYRFGQADVELMEQFATLGAMAVDAGRRLERERIESSRLRALYLATEQVGEGIALLDVADRIRYANLAYRSLHGLTDDELLGRPVAELMAPGSPWSELADQVKAEGDVRAEVRLLRRGGLPVEVELHARAVAEDSGEGAEPIGTVVLAHEIADRRATQARLERQAHTDSLTGLANRRRIIEAVGSTLGRGRPGGSGCVALLFVDLDRFKKINDGLGHRMGDVVLVEVAHRFGHALGTGPLLGRLGGDEFVVLLDSAADGQEALEVARRLAASLVEPIAVEGRRLVVTASIGVAVADVGTDVDLLLRQADAAMYQAKAGGRDTQVLLDPQSAPPFRAELDLEEELRQGIAEGQLRLALQPVVDLGTGRVNGFEALVRWAHPERGLLLPDDFLPLAEETGLVRPIGAWVLRRAVEVVAGYLQRFPLLKIGVNISPRQLAGSDLLDEIDEVTSRCAFPATQLVVEVTESLAMRPDSEETLRRIHERGVGVAIDDLGTGYSNLGYLKRLPISVLKVDQSFVAGLDTDDRDRAITATLVNLGLSLGMEVVAEGVESTGQLRVLRELGCPLGQGNLFAPAAPPVPVDQLAARIDLG